MKNATSATDGRNPQPVGFCLPRRWLQREYNVKTASSYSEVMPNGYVYHFESFGTLQDAGVLEKDYESAGYGGDPDIDMGYNILWTVLVACTINGKHYDRGDIITWEK